MSLIISTLLAVPAMAVLTAGGASGDEGFDPASFAGLNFHGSYVAYDGDGAPNCAADGPALALSFAGTLTPENTSTGRLGMARPEDAEIRVRMPDEPAAAGPDTYIPRFGWRLSRGDDAGPGIHSAILWLWQCSRTACGTAGQGRIELAVRPDGDIDLLHFGWSGDGPSQRVALADAENGPVRLGFCPDLRLPGRMHQDGL
ncbi:MAG: hypothetical protein ACK4NO_06955 [Glycocaulis sp.]